MGQLTMTGVATLQICLETWGATGDMKATRIPQKSSHLGLQLDQPSVSNTQCFGKFHSSNNAA